MKNERGQAMVLVVFAIVGMLAIAGLAIDGGRLHAQRRQVQNAADAAAMAGARALLQSRIDECEDDASSLNDIDDAVGQAILQYAQKNGVDHTVAVGDVEAWYVDADGNHVERAGAHWLEQSELDRTTGVEVTVTLTDTTTFLKVVGQNDMVAGGEATAMFGPVTQVGGGILPIGVPLVVVEALDPGEQFHILETNNPDGGSFCTDPDNMDTCVGGADDNAHRGWLNFNYIYNTEYTKQSDHHYRTFERNVSNQGCGDDPDISTDDGVKGWAGEDKNPKDGVADCPYPHSVFAGTPPDDDGTTYIDGDFIHGDPGARDISAQNVDNTYSPGEQIAYAPIFDHIYMSDYMDDRDDEFPDPEGIQWPQAGGYLYHIVGFVGIDIIDYEKGGGTNAIVGKFDSAILGGGEFTPGFGPAAGSGDPCSATVYGLSLWE